MATVFDSALKTGNNTGAQSTSTVQTVPTVIKRRLTESNVKLNNQITLPGKIGEVTLRGAQLIVSTAPTGIASPFTVTIGTSADPDLFATVTVSAVVTAKNFTVSAPAMADVRAFTDKLVITSPSSAPTALGAYVFIDMLYED